MSRPAQKARSPSARRTTALTSGSSFTRRQAALDLLAHRAVEGVEHLGPVQRDGGDPVGRRLVADRRRSRSCRRSTVGSRFSMNACGPSLASSVRTTRSRKASARISASCSGRSRLLRMARRVPRTASGALRLTSAAISRARVSRSSCVDDLGDQPELVGPLGAHALVAAGEGDPHGDVRGQHPGQPHHLPARDQPDAHVGVEELRPGPRRWRCRRWSPSRGRRRSTGR